MCATPVSTDVVDRGVEESPVSDTPVVPSDMLPVTCRFRPLNPQVAPMSTEVEDRVVVESPVTDVAFVVDSDMLPVTGRFTPLNPQGSQVSLLSSVQLSPNRVQSDFDLDAVDLYPIFATSPRSDGDLPHISPISSPESSSSHASPAAGSVPEEAAESCESAIGSPATSLPITYRTADLQLMAPPLIPLPDTILVQTDSALLLQLTQAYQDFLPPQQSVPVVDSPPVCPDQAGCHQRSSINLHPASRLPLSHNQLSR